MNYDKVAFVAKWIGVMSTFRRTFLFGNIIIKKNLIF
jgi:hypothetical protein